MSDNRLLYAASLCAAASFAILVLRWQRNGSRLPYPPGPRGYPLIGSALDVPRDIPIWKAFISIAKKHGTCFILAGVRVQLKTFRLQETDVLYMRLFSTDFVVLNSSEAISDLLDKRSSVYSDRAGYLSSLPAFSLWLIYGWGLARGSDARAVRHLRRS